MKVPDGLPATLPKAATILGLMLLSSLSFGQTTTIGLSVPLEYSPRLDRVRSAPELSLHRVFPGEVVDFVGDVKMLPLVAAGTGSLALGISVQLPWEGVRLQATAGVGGRFSMFMGNHFDSYAMAQSSLRKEITLAERLVIVLGAGIGIKQNMTNTDPFYRGEQRLFVPVSVELRL